MKEGQLPSILVVDDNQDNTDIIQHYLEVRGYPITVAHDGDEAGALLDTVGPNLAVLEESWRGGEGGQVCRLMKQHRELGKSVRIIMVTALDEWDDKRQAIQTGADDYVEKPFDLARLAQAVERNAALLPAPTS